MFYEFLPSQANYISKNEIWSLFVFIIIFTACDYGRMELKMVNIIIPAYNAHKTIRQTLASVAVQDNQDNIKLTIIDDCSDEPYDYLLNDYKYLNINIFKTPFNSGPGQARQYGIDHTDCEYLIFLDADDCFYSCDSVKKLLTTIKDGNYDVVSSIFLEETVNNNEYLPHKNDIVWMHGKIYRTQYIKERNIRFNEARTQEDSAFNTIILYTDANIYFTEYATYIWKNNKNSITRSSDYFSDSMDEFILNTEYTLTELIRLNVKKSNLCTCVLQYLISFYGYYLMFLKRKKNRIFLNNYILNLKRFYKNIPVELTEVITEEQLEQIFYKHVLINTIFFQNIIMTISIFDFIEMLKE